MKLLRHALMLLAVAGFLPANASAQLIPVDLELVLAVDVSGSVNEDRYLAQKNGYIAAFRNPLVHNAITGGAMGSIAVNYMEWSSWNRQSEQVAWTQIDDATGANAFADAIEATTRAFTGGRTGIAQAISWSANSLANNEYSGTRQVIDISGDGAHNTIGSPHLARDAAVDAGITINGIAIEELDPNLTETYENSVIGGTNSFVLTAATFNDFEAAILQKLQVEISGGDPTQVPLPGTLALIGLGLAGIGVFVRRRRID